MEEDEQKEKEIELTIGLIKKISTEQLKEIREYLIKLIKGD